ncbi:MAG: alpha/beta fold hydrolase [Gemmatimonadetes bacterium]|nr:alpha/beta fold hydrolase [Gemmatimonadota bacterium]
MPTITLNGVAVHVEDSGGDGEPVVFCHGLLMSSRMFEGQVAALAPRYRCVAYDLPGHGRSGDATGRSYPIEQAYDDTVALIERLGLGPCHFVGLSMGGFVGLRIAARRRELFRTLTLLETSADAEAPGNVPKYRRLAFVARLFGPGAVVAPVMPIMFGRTFLHDPAKAAVRARWRGELKANRRGIVRAVRGVIEREGVADLLPGITTPTLVMVGDEDVATPRHHAEKIRALVPGARLVTLPGAGHSSSVEQPELVNRALLDFLASPR